MVDWQTLELSFCNFEICSGSHVTYSVDCKIAKKTRSKLNNNKTFFLLVFPLPSPFSVSVYCHAPCLELPTLAQIVLTRKSYCCYIKLRSLRLLASTNN